MGQLVSALRHWCRKRPDADQIIVLTVEQQREDECRSVSARSDLTPEEVAAAASTEMLCEDLSSNCSGDEGPPSSSDTSWSHVSGNDEANASEDDISESDEDDRGSDKDDSGSDKEEKEQTERQPDDFTSDDPSQNIYFDLDTMKVKLNTKDKLKDLSFHVVPLYRSLCEANQKVICKLGDVLAGLEGLPEDATHLIVSLVNYHGDKFYIPFALDHLDDPFPFESTAWIYEANADEMLPDSLSLIHKVDGQMRFDDVTDRMLYFSWNLFSPGSFKFRPHAWTWLKELSPDPDAVLLLKRIIDGANECASFSLATQEIVDWASLEAESE